MSYTYLQEQGEESSVDTFSDIPQSVLLRLNLIADESCSNGNETESYPSSQFGMTLPHLMELRGEEKSMSCAEDFPAKTLVQREKAQESPGNEADCGKKWRGLLVKFNQDLFSSKTVLCSEQEDSARFLKILPKWGMMLDGELSLLQTPVRPIKENVCGFWPTPTASEARNIPATANYGQIGLNNHPRIRGLPTREKMQKSKRRATPTAHISKECGYPAEFTRRTPSLTSQAHGGKPIQQMPLNPVWVEWLMGWPLGWTDLKPLEMDKFQSWRQQHSDFFQNQ